MKKYATEKEIKIFEKENGVLFSEELKEYFRKINGLTEAEFNSKLNPLCDLKKVIDYDWFSNKEFSENEIIKYKKTYIIGDIMIDSHQWAVILNENGDTEKIIEMDSGNIMAESITDFLTIFEEESPYALVG